jgi:SAM-dependent methyltransferase
MEESLVVPPRSLAPGPAGFWADLKSHWRRVGPPLRPAPQDVAFYLEAIAQWAAPARPRVLLLGVTPEIYHLPWPENTDFLAVDRTQAMIDTVWPGPKSAALCRDWRYLDLPAASRDLAFCDGGLHFLPYPYEQGRLAARLGKILAPGGECIMRLYAPPARRETPAKVLEDLLAGRIRDLNILKLRLGPSLQRRPEEGVALGDIWQAVRAVARDFDALAAKIGWPAEHLKALNVYRDSCFRYFFVTSEQVCDRFALAAGDFELYRRYVPDYELGEQCPTLVWRRREA